MSYLPFLIIVSQITDWGSHGQENTFVICLRTGISLHGLDQTVLNRVCLVFGMTPRIQSASAMKDSGDWNARKHVRMPTICPVGQAHVTDRAGPVPALRSSTLQRIVQIATVDGLELTVARH